MLVLEVSDTVIPFIASEAITDKYYWSQSLQELTVEIEVGVCKASEIKVDITATRRERGCETLRWHGSTLADLSCFSQADSDQRHRGAFTRKAA